MTLQNHYSMNIIKYKVKYILYLKIFYRERKEAAYCYFGVKRVYFKVLNTRSKNYEHTLFRILQHRQRL